MEAMLAAVADRLVTYVESLGEQPAAYDVTTAGAVADSLRERWPTGGAPLDELLDLLLERAVPPSFNAPGPGYLAYIPGGGVFAGALGEFLAAAINRYTGVWVAAPGLVQLEANVIRWFCELCGLPATSGGFLTSGGSLANFSAVVTAREAKLPEDFLAGVVYTSDQVHHSVTKAAKLAGIPERRVRALPTDERFRLRTDALRDAIAQDRVAGLTPFLVVASAGTTNTGAIDPLDEIAEFCRRESLWFNVDPAYGGLFMLTDRGRSALEGIERADSITLDPHKGLFMPYGSGCLLVREPAALRAAHHVGAEYLPPDADAARPDYAAMTPELTRPYRGLSVWLALRLYGFDAFERQLEEKLDLIDWASERLRGLSRVEILAEPQLTVVAFRFVPEGVTDGDELNALNRRLLEAVNAKQRVHISGTMLDGRYALRLCAVSFRTHRARVAMALEDFEAAVGGL